MNGSKSKKDDIIELLNSVNEKIDEGAKMGKTKVFLKQAAFEKLEGLRKRNIDVVVRKMQATVRRWATCKQFNKNLVKAVCASHQQKKEKNAIIIQGIWRSSYCYNRYHQMRYSVMIIQLHVYCFLTKESQTRSTNVNDVERVTARACLKKSKMEKLEYALTLEKNQLFNRNLRGKSKKQKHIFTRVVEGVVSRKTLSQKRTEMIQGSASGIQKLLRLKLERNEQSTYKVSKYLGPSVALESQDGEFPQLEEWEGCETQDDVLVKRFSICSMLSFGLC